MKLLTDLEILETIYGRYYHEFASFRKDAANVRNSKVYVPIDVDKIGRELTVDGDIVFGRLYYHFNKKYGYINTDGSKVQFFVLELGSEGNKERHCIQFPLMASVLADLKYEHRKFRVATNVSVLALIISSIALIISLFKP